MAAKNGTIHANHKMHSDYLSYHALIFFWSSPFLYLLRHVL